MSDKNMKKFDKEAFTFVNNDRVLTDVKLDTKPVGYLRDAWNRFKKNKASVAATVIIALIALFAIIAPWCTPYKINQADGYYKQVRPKVSPSAKGLWDGGYNQDLNDSGYIALQAIAFAALDKDGTNKVTWDEATNYQYNPVAKINKTFETSSLVGSESKTSTFRNLHIDSYYKVGFVYVNGLSKEQYDSILAWQTRTGKQVIYPIVDTSDPVVFPESNRNDANEGNYWYAMTKNLTPLYPNDPTNLKAGYHEMTLEEVKQKGLWALYAKDYARDAKDDPYYYGIDGTALSFSNVAGATEFRDVQGNLVFRSVRTGDVITYFDGEGNRLNTLEGATAIFRNADNTLAGAIISSATYFNAEGNPLTAVTEENGNVEYFDAANQLVYSYNAQSEVYSDALGNPLRVAQANGNVFFGDADGRLIGLIFSSRSAYDQDGNPLTVQMDGTDVLYLDGVGDVVYKYVPSTKRYYGADGAEISPYAGLGATYFGDASRRFVGFISKLGDQDGRKIITVRNGDDILYQLEDGSVEYRYIAATSSYEDGSGNPLVVLNDAGNCFFKQTDGGWKALTFETLYKDADGNVFDVATQNGTTTYSLGGSTVYSFRNRSYYDASGNKLNVLSRGQNRYFVSESGVLIGGLLTSGVQYHDADGNLLTEERIFVNNSGNVVPAGSTGARLAIIRYSRGGSVVYTYDALNKEYFDAEGNELTQQPSGGAYFVNGQNRVIAGIQAPVADQIKMADITTSGEGGVFKNYRIRVLYYNYYQYLNDHEPVFVLGADSQGYDILVRLAHGCRLSLILAVAVSLINLVIGAIYGAIEGYYGGAVDMVMERITDILAGIPFIILVTLFKFHLVDTGRVSVLGGLLFAFVVTGWIGTAYSTRMQFYRFKGQEYILAARTLGANDFRLMFKHIFPNALGTLITSSVLVIPGVIFSETSLAYLGIVNFNGTNTTSLGTMLNNGQAAGINKFPHIIFFPALILSLLMISFNLFGNGLRDAFNPSLRGTEE